MLTPLSVFGAGFLYRRAGDVAVGTEDTAIAGKGLQDGAASFAIIEKLAGIGWHGFRFDMATLRAGQRRACLYFYHSCRSLFADAQLGYAILRPVGPTGTSGNYGRGTDEVDIS